MYILPTVSFSVPFVTKVEQKKKAEYYNHINYWVTKIRSTEGAFRGHQYGPRLSINPRGIASSVVLTSLGRIDDRGQTLKCLLVLLSE